MKPQAEKSKIKVRITDYEKKDFILNITEAERSARESKGKGGYFRVSFMMHQQVSGRTFGESFYLPSYVCNYLIRMNSTLEFESISFHHVLNYNSAVNVILSKEELWKEGDSILEFDKEEIFKLLG